MDVYLPKCQHQQMDATHSVVQLALKSAILALSIVSLHETLDQTSIATLSLYKNLFDAMCVLGILNLLLHVFSTFTVFCCTEWKGRWCLIAAAICLVFEIPYEAVIFKFVTCFAHETNYVLVARSVLVIALAAHYFTMGFIYSYSDWSTQDETKSKLGLLLDAAKWTALFLPAFVVFVVNCALLAQLAPPLNHQIGPYSIQMRFFNQTEIRLVQQGAFSKDDPLLYEARFAGLLSEAVFSPNRIRTSDPDLYLHVYDFYVACTNYTRRFYADCAENAASNLSVSVRYVDKGAYPRYNCVVHAANATHAYNCTQLFAAEYELVLVQEFNEHVEPAWTRLCKCYSAPNFRLTRDPAISAGRRSRASTNKARVSSSFLLAVLVVIFALL